MNVDLIQRIKNNSITSGAFVKIRSFLYRKMVEELVPYRVEPIVEENESFRLNLVLPTFVSSYVYGGITSALKVFQRLSELLGFEQRIIIVGDEKFAEKTSYHLSGFSHNGKDRGIFFLAEDQRISVRKSDIFLFSSWITAYVFYPVHFWQKKTYGTKERKVIYLIQDYEPGFHPWSAVYMLAESTYHEGTDTIAVFNSKELRTYFENNGYRFCSEWAFSPELNHRLRELLLNNQSQERKKRIILYARPATPRNAFQLIYDGLKLWANRYDDAKNWEILALGDKFVDLPLPGNSIRFLGKLSLEEYGEIMLTSYAGISLMISPHPSYPPLEMSTFGVRTITNCFANKDLSSFNRNIISMKKYTPEDIADALETICREYGSVKAEPITTGDYIEGNDLERTMSGVAAEIAKRENKKID